jgi:hypothetical protein
MQPGTRRSEQGNDYQKTKDGKEKHNEREIEIYTKRTDVGGRAVCGLRSSGIRSDKRNEKATGSIREGRIGPGSDRLELAGAWKRDSGQLPKWTGLRARIHFWAIQ